MPNVGSTNYEYNQQSGAPSTMEYNSGQHLIYQYEELGVQYGYQQPPVAEYPRHQRSFQQVQQHYSPYSPTGRQHQQPCSSGSSSQFVDYRYQQQQQQQQTLPHHYYYDHDQVVAQNCTVVTSSSAMEDEEEEITGGQQQVDQEFDVIDYGNVPSNHPYQQQRFPVTISTSPKKRVRIAGPFEEEDDEEDEESPAARSGASNNEVVTQIRHGSLLSKTSPLQTQPKIKKLVANSSPKNIVSNEKVLLALFSLKRCV